LTIHGAVHIMHHPAISISHRWCSACASITQSGLLIHHQLQSVGNPCLVLSPLILNDYTGRWWEVTNMLIVRDSKREGITLFPSASVNAPNPSVGREATATHLSTWHAPSIAPNVPYLVLRRLPYKKHILVASPDASPKERNDTAG
jgi:hypothetical protein